MVEDEDATVRFTVTFHFEANARGAAERSRPMRMKRLAQETVTLSTALPLSYSSGVYVRCDQDRLDIMKVLCLNHCILILCHLEFRGGINDECLHLMILIYRC